MRIALLNLYYAPAEAATAQLLSDLGQSLAEAGHDVTAICSRRSYPDPTRTFPAVERIEGVEVRRVWTTGFGRATRVGRLADYLGFLIGASRVLGLGPRADVIVSLTTPPMVAAVAVALARVRRTRSMFWVMDVYPDLAFALGALDPRSPAAPVLRSLARWTLRHADRVVAIGETMAERLARSVPRAIEVVHNWADGERIRPLPTAGHPLRAAWGWEGRFVALYSGNLGLAHEFETMLEAARRLAERPDILFAFVGNGPRRAAVEERARRMGLRNVEFRAHVEREGLDWSLTAGDVHLISLREGMSGLLVPSKIYGILAAGRPAIYVGPAAGEIDAIVREGPCGVQCVNGDVAGLVGAIRAYADDAGRRAADGERGRRLFEQRFSKARALASLRESIEGLGRERA